MVSIPYQSGQSFRPRAKRSHHARWSHRFQSPTNRGSLSDRAASPGCTNFAPKRVSIPYQSGQSFRRHGIFPSRRARSSFNPLPIGAVFPTSISISLSLRIARTVSIPYQSGQSFRHAGRRGGGSLRVMSRFNPLPIGAVFPTTALLTYVGSHDFRFNPLPIGAVFPT